MVVAALALLVEAFKSNQKVLDVFNTAFEATSIMLNDFVNFVVNNFGTVVDYFKKVFDDPVGSLKKFGDAIKENLIERFESFIDTLGFVADGIKELFSGDVDAALENFKKAGKEAVDIYTGVDGTVDKVINGVTQLVEATSEYTKEVIKQAKATVDLNKQAEINAVINQGLIEKYDRQAEQQRKIRDDVRLSIDERIKANEKLGKILEEQQKVQLENAQAAIRLADINLKKDKNNVEFIKARIEAQNELLAIQATIEGFTSEQQTNEAALQQESIDLDKSKIQSQQDLLISSKEFNAELIEDDLLKLDAQKKNLEEEEKLITKRLENEILLYKEGTQAKADAEAELASEKERFRQEEILLTKTIEETKTQIEEENKNKRLEIMKAEEDARQQQLSLVKTNLDSLANIFDAFGKESKAIAIAGIITDQISAVSRIISNTAIANAKAVAASPLTAGQPFVGIEHSNSRCKYRK